MIGVNVYGYYIGHGINTKGLPVIVIYPDFTEKKEIHNKSGFTDEVRALWDKLPIFRDSMDSVATLHTPYKYQLIKEALDNPDLMVQTMKNTKKYFYKVD